MRETVCRSGWVKIETCVHSFGWDAEAEAIVCAWCGKEAGTLPFGTPDFTLPAALNVIEESAFEGLTAMTVVDAGSVTSVGANAFKDCSALNRIRLPKNCTIDPDAFTGCGTVYIFAPGGGSTEAYCNAHENCVFVEE